jgi:hypothetical protein
MANPIAALALGEVVKVFDAQAIDELSSSPVAVPAGASVARKVLWQVSFDAAPDAVQVDIEGSLNNVDFISLASTTSVNGALGVVPSMPFLRATVSGLTAGSATTMTVAFVLSSGWDVYRDILPGTDGTYSLGNANFRFSKLFAGVVTEDATPVDSVAATATITYGASAVTAGKQVTFGGITYTFRVTVAADYDIKIEAAVDDTAANLVNAINLDAAPGVGDNAASGKYMAPAANPFASASLNAGSNLITLTALVTGEAGNVAFPTTDETQFTVSDFETEDTGVDMTPDAIDGQIFKKSDNSLLYVAIGNSPTGSWKKITMAALS